MKKRFKIIMQQQGSLEYGILTPTTGIYDTVEQAEKDIELLLQARPTETFYLIKVYTANPKLINNN